MTNSTNNVPINLNIKCNGVGKYINASETHYYCSNQTVTLTDYLNLVGKKGSVCFKNDTQLDICYCPKDYNGIQCESNVKTICKFDTVSSF